MAIVNISENTMMRFGKLDEMEKSFDVEFWQKQTSNERFTAISEMVESYHLRKGGKKDELRLQRTVEHFQRKSS
jgi:hypothetical protein